LNLYLKTDIFVMRIVEIFFLIFDVQVFDCKFFLSCFYFIHEIGYYCPIWSSTLGRSNANECNDNSYFTLFLREFF